MLNASATNSQKSIARAVIIAYFYAMRSCEFSEVNGERKTMVVTLACAHFSSKNKSTARHDDDDIFSAFAVSVTFRTQNNGDKEERTTQENTGDSLLNPVPQLADLIRMLRDHPASSDDTKICTFIDDNNKLRTLN